MAGRPALKPGSLIGVDEPVAVAGPPRRYASRGGEKLARALDRFEVSVEGRRCLDVGASTGGFTDVLLSRGAVRVVTVDVGYGQLAWRLRQDPRVTVMERTNARWLRPQELPYRPDLEVADVSFISLAAILPTLATVAAPGADLLLLIKPQFEARPEEVGGGGVVGDPDVWRRAVEGVAAACRERGLAPAGVIASPITGPAGNVEFFIHARQGADPVDVDVSAALAEARKVRAG